MQSEHEAGLCGVFQMQIRLASGHRSAFVPGSRAIKL